MSTIANLRVGDDFPPNGTVYHVTELPGGWRKLVIERSDGSLWTTHQHASTSLADAYDGGSYHHDSHLA